MTRTILVAAIIATGMLTSAPAALAGGECPPNQPCGTNLPPDPAPAPAPVHEAPAPVAPAPVAPAPVAPKPVAPKPVTEKPVATKPAPAPAPKPEDTKAPAPAVKPEKGGLPVVPPPARPVTGADKAPVNSAPVAAPAQKAGAEANAGANVPAKSATGKGAAHAVAAVAVDTSVVPQATRETVPNQVRPETPAVQPVVPNDAPNTVPDLVDVPEGAPATQGTAPAEEVVTGAVSAAKSESRPSSWMYAAMLALLVGGVTALRVRRARARRKLIGELYESYSLPSYTPEEQVEAEAPAEVVAEVEAPAPIEEEIVVTLQAPATLVDETVTIVETAEEVASALSKEEVDAAFGALVFSLPQGFFSEETILDEAGQSTVDANTIPIARDDA